MLEVLVMTLLAIFILFGILLVRHAIHIRYSFSITGVCQLLREYWKLALFIIIAFAFSTVRAVFVDRPIVVSDGYDQYAVLLSQWLRNPSINLDTSLGGYHFPFRIVYSLLIAIPLAIAPLDILLLGRVISILSFLATIPLLDKIMGLLGLKEISGVEEAVLILYVTNVTIVTALVRFGTDMLFLALLMCAIVVYERLLERPLKESRLSLLLLVILCALLFFTREVGLLFCGSIGLHQFWLQNRKIKLSILAVALAGIITMLFLGVLDDFLYYLVWTSSSSRFATELVLHGDLAALAMPLASKFLSVPNLLSTIEAVFYAFGMPLLVSMLGIYYMIRNPQKRGFLRGITFLYFIVFILFYVFLKIGRGIDRFFLPILFIPYLTVPYGLKVFIYGNEEPAVKASEWLPYKMRLVFATLIVSQLLIYILRTILSFFGQFL